MSKATRRARRQRERSARALPAAAVGGPVPGTAGSSRTVGCAQSAAGGEGSHAEAWQETAGPGVFSAAAVTAAFDEIARDGNGSAAADGTANGFDNGKDDVAMSTGAADVMSDEAVRNGDGRPWQEMAGPEEFSTGGGWSPLQERFALALARGMRVAEAAKACGISDRTAFRWRALTGFREHVEEYRSQLFDEALGRLAERSADAADALERLLGSEDERIVLRAAQQIFHNAHTLRQQAQLEERVLRLERRAGMAGTVRGGLGKRIERLEEQADEGTDRHTAAEQMVDELGLKAMLKEHREFLDAGDAEAARGVITRLLARVEEAPPAVRRAFEQAIEIVRKDERCREERLVMETCAAGA